PRGDAAATEDRALAIQRDQVPSERVVRSVDVPGVVALRRITRVRPEVAVVAGGTGRPVLVVPRRRTADALVGSPPGHVIRAGVLGRRAAVVLAVTERQ